MLQTQVAGKVVGDQIGVAAGHRGAHRAHHLQTGVDMLGADVIDERRIAEAHLLAVRTGEALRQISAVRFAAVEHVEVGARQDALHRMIGAVPCARRALLVAAGAQIVVVADQAFVAAAAKV